MTEFSDSSGSGFADSDPEAFSVPLDAVRPSQLHLNGRKLSLVTEWFDFADPNYDPLPVGRFETDGGDDRWTLTDAPTRAFVAHLAGADGLRIVRDEDDLDVEIYRECVGWCEDEDVTEIADLAGRVLNADDFEEQWVEQCQAVAESEE